MARSRKDQPNWVRLNKKADRVGEEHRCPTTGVCDLNKPRTATDKHRFCAPILRKHSSLWDNGGYNPRRVERRTEYWKPERRFVRTELAKAAQSGEDVGTRVTQNPRHHVFPYGHWD